MQNPIEYTLLVWFINVQFCAVQYNLLIETRVQMQEGRGVTHRAQGVTPPSQRKQNEDQFERENWTFSENDKFWQKFQ